MKTQISWNYPQNTIIKPSSFLANRLREDSNLELDWLWAAEQVTDISEKLYCVERALYINPANQTSRHQFDNMSRLVKATDQTSSMAPNADLQVQRKRFFRFA